MNEVDTRYRAQTPARKRHKRSSAATFLLRLCEIIPAIVLLVLAAVILFPSSKDKGGETDTSSPPTSEFNVPANPDGGPDDIRGDTGDNDTGTTEPIYTDQYTPALLVMAEKNPEAAGFAAEYTGARAADLTMDLTNQLTPGEIPYFTQWDSRWGYSVYGTGLMGWTGCGPTVLSMVAMGLTGDGTLTPAFVADMAVRGGYCVEGNGTAWTLFSEGAKSLGLVPKELPLWESTVRAELEAGKPVVCVVGPGHFTENGHYILLTKADEEGYHVLDPFRPSNCHAWNWADFSEEIRNLWSYTAEKK